MANDGKTALRADIQALRAVAVLAVVLFHLWPNRLTGGYVGVDVFFVISGFLITSHIARDVDAGRFSVTTFWARRMLRLLPASLLVLAVTAGGVWALAPIQHWEQWFREIAASGLYAQNWILAADAVDYLAAENVTSPVQHYWSLSAEEQFYLVWPLLIGLSLLVGRFLRRSSSAGQAGRRESWRPVAAGLLTLVVVVSLVTSVVWTEADQAFAYFITPTRAWEFGAGALLAFVPAWGRSRTAAGRGGPAGVVAWVGLALIVISAIGFTSTTPFPGAWAAVPVLGTVLVIWARATDRFTTGLAGLAPVQFLGDVSYAVYLWHWPLIVLLPYATGHDLRTGDKLAILAATVLLAWATRTWIEKPVLRQRHRFRPAPTFISAAVATALVLGVALAGVHAAREHVRAELAAVAALTSSECFGAASRPLSGPSCVNPDLDGVAVPAPDAAHSDVPELFRGRCAGTSKTDSQPKPCSVGAPDGSVRVALIGDSHAVQYSAMLASIAERNGWELDTYSKGACPFSDVRRAQDDVLHAACTTWIERAKVMLVEGDYDLVVTSQVSGVDWEPPQGTSTEEFAEGGLASLWSGLADRGVRVVAVADVPRPMRGVLDCLQEPERDVTTDCRVSRADGLLYDPQPGAVERLNRPDVTLLDLTDVYCDDRECLPVIGGATVYRDSNHLTNTFARTLEPYFEAGLVPLVGADRS
ncbi:acyltransferase family protein [Promicromonospora iranensis]|uniref:Peptidoglycan/LPS O-acetylase OafA/YrhL n=1 Tax=Promicromonospora iranensis TaxID=1105144 RepID=A0ABU2CHL6_9MICO|nr:acyltransferase family protein [Promicromonospora iranensis]MDR7380825.1 peptidoglycan/LPS O-acetylase OafA/YrhL [Promicromonospora iranensis]